MQVLQLPGHLEAAVFQESSVKLDTCLAHLPPHLHPAALCAVIPEVATCGVLRVDYSCSRWSAENRDAVSAYERFSRNCVATPAVLCALLKAVASHPQLCELHLDIEYCTSSFHTSGASSFAAVSAPDFLTCTLSTLTQLKALSLGGLLSSSEMISDIAALLPDFPLLEQFSVVDGLLDLSPELAASLGRCTRLRHLHFNASMDFSDHNVLEPLPFAGLQRVTSLLERLSQLQHLALINFAVDSQGDAALSHILSCLTGLRSLNMSGCRETPTGCGVHSSLVQACASITTLVCISSLVRATC